MAWVYILRGSTGRHYIGSTVDLNAHFAQHLRRHTAATERRGDKLEIVAKKQVTSLRDARKIERVLKQNKNPKLAIYHLREQSSPESFRGWLRKRSEFSPLALLFLTAAVFHLSF